MKGKNCVRVLAIFLLTIGLLAVNMTVPERAQASSTYEVLMAPNVASVSGQAQDLGVIKVKFSDTVLAAYSRVTVSLPADLRFPHNPGGAVPVSTTAGPGVTVVATGQGDCISPVSFAANTFSIRSNNNFTIRMGSADALQNDNPGPDRYFYIYFNGIDVNNMTGDITVSFIAPNGSVFSSSSDIATGKVITKKIIHDESLKGSVMLENSPDHSGVMVSLYKGPRLVARLTTPADGHFTFSNLVSGTYSIEASKNRWQTVRKDDIEIEYGEITELPTLVLNQEGIPIPPGEEQVQVPADTITDSTGHWAETAINELVKKGIVAGYPDGSFKPDNHISRAEFTSILVKAIGLNPGGKTGFADLEDHWARDYIATATGQGIVSGYSSVRFGPEDNITREQMAVMIAKAARLPALSEKKEFKDNNIISSWAREAVTQVSTNNLITGYPDQTFRPQNHTTRAEAVSVISRLSNI
jgi:hypothetical protein